MSEPVLDWLPKGAVTVDAVRAASAGIVARWSERWFHRAAASVCGVRGEASPTAFAPWLRRGRVAAVAFAEGGQDVVLKSALGANPCVRDLGDGDVAVLNALCDEIADDLVAILDERLAAAPGRDASPETQVDIALQERKVLTVSFATCTIVPLLKACMTRAAPGVPLRSRIEALGRTPIVADALLGTAQVALCDLEEMAPGDVLVLGTSLSDPIELRVSRGAQIGAGKLLSVGGQISIQF